MIHGYFIPITILGDIFWHEMNKNRFKKIVMKTFKGKGLG
jgi:hypothetical protein